MESRQSILRRVRENGYDIIGFNCLHPSLARTMELMWDVHRVAPDACIVAGGHGASPNREALFKYSPVSAIVAGWGEFPILGMALDVSYPFALLKERFGHIGGMYVREGQGYSFNGYAPCYTQNDLRSVSLLFDYSLVPFRKYRDYVTRMYVAEFPGSMSCREYSTVFLYTSSHCPMGCDFCSCTRFLDDAVDVKKQRVLMLSAEDIFRMVESALAAHPEADTFYFSDDNFMLDRELVRKFCELVTERMPDAGLQFLCYSKIDAVDAQTLGLMKAAGFRTIVFGWNRSLIVSYFGWVKKSAEGDHTGHRPCAPLSRPSSPELPHG